MGVSILQFTAAPFIGTVSAAFALVCSTSGPYPGICEKYHRSDAIALNLEKEPAMCGGYDILLMEHDGSTGVRW